MSLSLYTRLDSACGAVKGYRIEVEDADESRYSWADEFGMWW
jgi:hypothetical protein